MVSKLVKVPYRGPIYAKGGIFGPINTPYMEDERTIFNMISRQIPVIEILKDGSELALTVMNFDRDNNPVVITPVNTDVVVDPVVPVNPLVVDPVVITPVNTDVVDPVVDIVIDKEPESVEQADNVLEEILKEQQENVVPVQQNENRQQFNKGNKQQFNNKNNRQGQKNNGSERRPVIADDAALETK